MELILAPNTDFGTPYGCEEREIEIF